MVIVWSLFLTTSMEHFMYIQTPKETNREIKTKRHTFSLVSDTVAEKSCFFLNIELT